MDEAVTALARIALGRATRLLFIIIYDSLKEDGSYSYRQTIKDQQRVEAQSLNVDGSVDTVTNVDTGDDNAVVCIQTSGRTMSLEILISEISEPRNSGS